MSYHILTTYIPGRDLTLQLRFCGEEYDDWVTVGTEYCVGVESHWLAIFLENGFILSIGPAL